MKPLIAAMPQFAMQPGDGDGERRQLASTEASMLDILENASDLVQSVAPDGSFLYVNRAWREAFGYSDDELAQLRLPDIIHPSQHGSCQDLFQRVMLGQRLTNITSKFVTKDGQVLLVEGNVNCRFVDGRPVATRGVFRNISERLRSEAALLVGERKYRALFNECHDAIYISSREGQFLEANQAAHTLFGYGKGEMIGTGVLEIYQDSTDRERFRQAIEANGSVRDFDIGLRRRDGELLECQINASLRRDAAGNILGYQGIIRDLTLRNRDARRLQESEERYRDVFDNAHDLIHIISPEGDILFVNPAWKKALGYSDAEIGRMSVMDIIDDAYRENCMVFFQDLLRGENKDRIEKAFLARDGRKIYVEGRCSCKFEDGRVVAILSIFRDVSERMAAEQALRRSAEKVKMFAYSVSHDLKNPSIALHGITKLLHKQYGDRFDEKGKAYCQQVLKSSQQIAELVDKINIYIAAEEMPLSIEPVDLNELLAQVWEEFSERAADRQVQCDIQSQLPTVRADRVSLQRVVRNLIDNALKYGGRQLTRISLGYKAESTRHLLSVSDNGVGLNLHDPGKLFTHFRRGETAVGVQGTGLGLAIVKELVEQHQGDVWLESEPGRGTTFSLSIANNL